MIKLLLASPKTEESKGGIAVWTDAFLENCEQYGISCDLLNLATIGKRAKQGNSKRNFRDEFIRTKNIFRHLRAMVHAQAYDVAHINTSCGTFGLIRDYLTVRKIKKKQPLCKTIVHFHCDIQVQCASKLSRFFLSKILKKSNRILVLNQRNVDYLYNNYGVSSTVIPNFIDEAMVRSETKIISSEMKEAVFVGYVRPEKGIRELYEAAKGLPQITFRLIGEIHEDVMGWDKPANVILCGKKKHSDILLEIDKADVFIFLSHSEGFSIALLESMARGLPCIATDVGANAEMLENKGGVIVSVGDISAIFSAFKAIETTQIREKMSLWNIEKVKSNYITKQVIKYLEMIYNF